MSSTSKLSSSQSYSQSYSTFEPSVRPSRRNTVSCSDYVRNGLTSLSFSSEHRTSLWFLVNILRESGMPHLLCMEDKALLGQGAQFAVYEDRLCKRYMGTGYIAAKQPKFAGGLLSNYSLAEPEAQKHIHAIALEILALTDPNLREHPNIVRLLGWSVDDGLDLSPLTLVMDLASYDLATFLRTPDLAPTMDIQYALCVDIANGLDHLHDNGLLHGDMKPQNILLFKEQGRFVAKIADFGLSVYGHRVSDEGFRLGGTAGWQAPEVEAGILHPLRYATRSERYSYGLLVWSVCVHYGNVPPRETETSRQLVAKYEMEKQIKEECALFSALVDVVQHCLEPDPYNRPRRLMRILPDLTAPETSLVTLFQEVELSQTLDEGHLHTLRERYDPFMKVRYERWEPANITIYYARYALSEFSRAPDSIPDHCLFEFFLFLYDRNMKWSNGAALDLLSEAARRGYTPARSILPTIYRYHGLTLPDEAMRCARDWLCSAVADGSILGKADLQRLDHRLFKESVTMFRDLGGYNPLYFDNWRIQNAGLGGLEGNWSHLHFLAAWGSFQELRDYLENNPGCGVNDVTDNGETALYLGSLRGSWEIVQELMRNGADPSIPCTECSITCLHWLFCFDEDVLADAVSEFIARGADIDAIVLWELPFYHYPFTLPTGTPLHWAIVTSNAAAVEALYHHGANFHLRNFSDPYTFDRRVRYLGEVGGDDINDYSIPEIEMMGLSALDLSAMLYEPALFRLLVSRQQTNIEININAVDEEGFGVLHHLSTHPQRRTRLGLPFSYPPFMGAHYEFRARLREIVATVKRLGGDFDLLTTTLTCQSQPCRATLTNYQNLSPLMLAMMYGQADVVEVLLEYGADPNKENEAGETALELLYRIHEDCVPNNDNARRCVELLVASGAKVNHRSNYGASPLSVACEIGLLAAAEVLLVNNAAIIEPEVHSDTQSDYSALWSLGLREMKGTPLEGDCRLGLDQSTVGLLERHVFSLADPASISRIVNGYNALGKTMLFRFAEFGMHLSVDVLLRNGVDPNQPCLSRKFLSGKFRPRIHTALDVARISLESLKENAAKRTGRYTREEFDRLCSKYSMIIEALKSNGGVVSLTGETEPHVGMGSDVLPNPLLHCLSKTSPA